LDLLNKHEPGRLGFIVIVTYYYAVKYLDDNETGQSVATCSNFLAT